MSAPQTVAPPITLTPPTLHAIRRESLLHLLHEFSKQELAAGKPAKGLEVQFAQVLNLSPSRLSQLKKSRNISNKLAAQIESHASKALGWLDLPRSVEIVTDAEAAFLALAKQAWKDADSKGKRRLMQLAKQAFD